MFLRPFSRAVALDDNSLRASGAKEVCAALARLPLLRSATLSNTQLKVSAVCID
jgi:hypothetical protein